MVEDPLHAAPRSDAREQVAVTARLDELLGNRSGREVALVAGLVGRFPAKASDLVERWSQATLAGERQEAVRAVHTLKGTALNLGSSSLSHVCEEIESWSHQGDPDGEALHRERLQNAVAAFARTLTQAAGAPASRGSGPPAVYSRTLAVVPRPGLEE